jgi:hypothetical protein
MNMAGKQQYVNDLRLIRSNFAAVVAAVIKINHLIDFNTFLYIKITLHPGFLQPSAWFRPAPAVARMQHSAPDG